MAKPMRTARPWAPRAAERLESGHGGGIGAPCTDAAARVFPQADARTFFTCPLWCALVSRFFWARIGRVDVSQNLRAAHTRMPSNAAYPPLEHSPEHGFTAGDCLPYRDPKGALIAGTARALDAPLITRVARLHELRGLKCVW